MEKTETVVEVIEEVAGATLNKAALIGGVVVGGALAFVLVPKAIRKLRSMFGKKVVKTEKLPVDEEVKKEE